MPLSNNTDEVLNSAQASDKSVGFLNDIFGVGWDKILEGVTPAGGAGTVVFELFFAFNAVILACVAALMFYVISAGVVGTAHEGESLGKRYSTLWTPIRGAFSISLLMPLPWVKLALIQAILLKFVFYSIGGADYLAVKTVEFMAKQNGAISAPMVPMPLAEDLAEEMLKNLVVQEYFQEREGQSYGEGIKTLNSEQSTLSKLSLGYFHGESSMGVIFTPPNGGDIGAEDMGALRVICLADGNREHCASENNAGIELADELRGIAKAIVSKWADGANTPMDEQQESLYRSAINTYAKNSQQAAINALSTKGFNNDKSDAHQAELDDLVQAVKNNGWVWLPSYYWKISRLNENAQMTIQAKLVVAPGHGLKESIVAEAAGKEIDATLARYHNFVGAVEKGRKNQSVALSSGSGGSGMGSLISSLVIDAVGSSFGEDRAMKGAAAVVAGTIATGDPISNLQKLGHSVINTGTVLISLGLGAKGGEVGWQLTPAGKAFTALASAGGKDNIFVDGLKWVMGIVISMGFGLILTGTLLAYYLPAMPFIVSTAGTIGWLILVIELMVAAPIWAAMHAIPEGEGMAGQHGKQGYMLFFGILLRPSLHVMGFFMGFLVINVAGHFVGQAYSDFTESSNNDSLPIGPLAHIFAWIATLVIGTGVAIAASHKAFSLITWLPDHILRWAGGNSPSLGEGGDEQRSSHMFAAAMSRTQSIVTSIPGAGVKKAMTPPKQPKINHSQGNK